MSLDEQFNHVMAKNVTPIRPEKNEPRPKIRIFKTKVKKQAGKKKFVNIHSIEKEIDKIK